MCLDKWKCFKSWHNKLFRCIVDYTILELFMAQSSDRHLFIRHKTTVNDTKPTQNFPTKETFISHLISRTASVTCGSSLTLMVSQLTRARCRIWPRIITGWVSGSDGDRPTEYFNVAILWKVKIALWWIVWSCSHEGSNGAWQILPKSQLPIKSTGNRWQQIFWSQTEFYEGKYTCE